MQLVNTTLLLLLQTQKWCRDCRIHGLWPQTACYCPSEPYKGITDTTLRNSLLEAWSAPCEGSSSDTLWSHEWTKHGSCSGLPIDTYFQRGLDLFSRHRDALCREGHLCFTLDGQVMPCGPAPVPESCKGT